MNAKNITTHNGFTLVELLIVIVVIGILAAISTVAYGNISGRAKDAKLRAAASSAEKLINIKKVETGTMMPSATSTNIEEIKKQYGLTALNNDIVVQYFDDDGCVGVKSDTCSWGEIYDEATDEWRDDPQLVDKVIVSIHEYDESRTYCHSGITISYKKNVTRPGDEGWFQNEISDKGESIGCYAGI